METAPPTTIEWILIFIFFFSLMILPGIIAYYTNHRRKFLIAIVSLLLGWTVFVGLFTLTLVLAQSNLKHSKLAKWAEKTGEKKLMAGVMIFALTCFLIAHFLL